MRTRAILRFAPTRARRPATEGPIERKKGGATRRSCPLPEAEQSVPSSRTTDRSRTSIGPPPPRTAVVAALPVVVLRATKSQPFPKAANAIGAILRSSFEVQKSRGGSRASRSSVQPAALVAHAPRMGAPRRRNRRRRGIKKKTHFRLRGACCTARRPLSRRWPCGTGWWRLPWTCPCCRTRARPS